LTVVLYLPPSGAPRAFHTLAESFASMMTSVGLNVSVLKHDNESQKTDSRTVLFAWRPFETPGKRKIEIIVDGDSPPTIGVERVYPSKAWRNFLWGKYGQARLDEHFGTVISNWVDPTLWPLSFTTEDYLLYVGRLWPNKYGLLPRLIEELPKQRFVIIGSGDRKPLEGPNVEFLGELAQPEIAKLMGRARALLCPSLYCEPFGLTAIEASLTGTHVLASSVGAFVETLPEEDSLVEPYDILEWIKVIKRLPTTGPESSIIRQHRRNWHIQRHSPRRVGEQYLDLIGKPPPTWTPHGPRDATEAKVEQLR
jgi:glycosyltransferase involved in cell wall biosynthesis